MNETLRTAGDRCVLRMERRLAHPQEKVWRAITEPEHLNQWYPMPATRIDLRVGGTIGFDVGGDPNMPGQSTMEGTVTECDPPRVFAFSTPAGDVLENERDNLNHFELRPDGDGCLLVFTHMFYDRPFAASYAAGWTDCLNALEMVLDERPVEWPEHMVENFEAFMEKFGLNRGSTEDTPDGWRVRFDRQLMQASATTPVEHPVEQVWAALKGADPGVPPEKVTAPAVGDPPPDGFTTARVPSGPVTAAEAPTVLEYDWQCEDRTAGRVRWELSSTPAGTRITVTQTGPPELAGQRSVGLAAWRAHIEDFVRRFQAERSPS
ncbi:MAG: hypothetical protein GEU93_01875 [Propionibacteriales bacterium]|nr:hypothetical protein [Propionibacteriales bacterium]